MFGLYNFRKAEELLQSGVLALADLDEARLAGDDRIGEISPSQRHRLQVREAKGKAKGVVLERNTLRRTFEEWRFPLHFIDFETARPPLPFHRGYRPYELLLFQFSHHLLEAHGRLRHAGECLVAAPGTPPSASVIRALRAALSDDDGTIVHWWDHEKTVLKDIRRQLLNGDLDDRQELVEFVDRLVGTDEQPARLADIGRLVSRTAFFPGTAGRSSIKSVLPAVLARSAKDRKSVV